MLRLSFKISVIFLAVFSVSLFFPFSFSLGASSLININAQVGTCTDTSWTPDASTVCSGTIFTQTSNCGNTQSVSGTKACGGGGGGGGGGALPPSGGLSILELKVINITSSSATISWRASALGSSQLKYGLSNNYELKPIINNIQLNTAVIPLAGLLPQTRYYFRLIITDISGSQAVGESFFDTLAKGEEEPAKDVCPRPADINGDKRVNLIDFSILLYNWPNLRNKKADLNCDGALNLTDFSILLYYWQG